MGGLSEDVSILNYTKECQKNLVIRLTDLFYQIKEGIDIITEKLNAVRFPHFEKQPKIHVVRFQHADLNSHLLSLFISYRTSGEKLIKYQSNSSCVNMSEILMTTLFYKALILQGEILC